MNPPCESSPRRTVAVVIIGALVVAYFLIASMVGPVDHSRPAPWDPPPGDVATDSTIAPVSDASPRRSFVEEELGPRALGGTRLHFRLRTEEGNWDEVANGTAKVFWDGMAIPPQPLLIEHGRSLLPAHLGEAQTGDPIGIISLVLNGRPANVIAERTPIKDRTNVSVECQYRVSVIRVYSGNPAVECTNVTLCSCTGWEAELYGLPIQDLAGDPVGTLLAHVPSPIVLEDKNGTQVYFVRAPGQAWRKVAVDHDSPGEHRVLLRSGGDVRVTVMASAGLPDGVKLRVSRGPGSDPMTTVAAEANASVTVPTMITGLGEGDWVIRAELGMPNSSPLILAEAPFVVVPGETADVSLQISKPVVVNSGHLHGLVVYAPDQETPSGSIVIKAIDSWNPQFRQPFELEIAKLERSPLGPAVLAWRAGVVFPGKYRIEVRSAQLGRLIEIESGADRFEVLDVSDAAVFSVAVREKGTGRPIHVQSMVYRRIGGVDGNCTGYSVPSQKLQPFQPVPLSVRPGLYRFSIVDVEGRRWKQELELTAGSPEMVLYAEQEIFQKLSIACTLECDGVRWPVDDGWWDAVSLKNAKGEVVEPLSVRKMSTGLSQIFARCTFVLGVEEQITMTFPSLDGFATIDPIVVSPTGAPVLHVPILLGHSF